ncbi:MAG: hypothetical protein ACYS0D_01050 [Planctomycetota bacterium]|jgi:hypothetical protein
MLRDAFRPDRKLAVGSIALALAALTTFTPTASSAERMVLGEFFTWIDCPACSVAEPVVDNMVDLYGLDGTDPNRADTLALLTFHLWDGYQLPWGSIRAQNFYNSIFLGTPCFVHDGNYDAWPIDTYVNKFLTRQSVPTTVTMSIFAEETSPNRYDTTVEVCLEAGAPPVNLRIYTVLAEDNYPIIDPQGNLLARNFFRVAAPTTDVSLAAGECAEVNNLMIAPPVTEQANMRLVAWAQAPGTHGPLNVYQAAIDAFPFEPPAPDPCPWDCGNDDGEVGINDFLAMLADWGGPGPCDMDGGGVIDINDFLVLLAHWGPCPK